MLSNKMEHEKHEQKKNIKKEKLNLCRQLMQFTTAQTC